MKTKENAIRLLKKRTNRPVSKGLYSFPTYKFSKNKILTTLR